jgi:hypothetical protein
MGAWGHKSFENDDALDWLGDLKDSDEATIVRTTLEAVTDAKDDVDTNDACAALAAAEIVAAALGRGDDRLDEDALEWVGQRRSVFEPADGALAARAVARVLAKSSLQELWSEGGGGNDWRADVQELLRRLSPRDVGRGA